MPLQDLIPGISRSEILDRAVSTPPVAEQRQIAAVLDTCVLQIKTAVEAITSLRSEKAALMQQLLTGKRRVRV